MFTDLPVKPDTSSSQIFILPNLIGPKDIKLFERGNRELFLIHKEDYAPIILLEKLSIKEQSYHNMSYK